LGVTREHADLVPAGYAILDAALATLGLSSVIPTSRGVAEGLLDEMLA
ncbi:MAG: Ppx/GppA family phosphatase, partial [Planctomycetes bacterium]|nr:Ppx/GppA family phosphatase [Planctomycetota bacterium]